MYRREVGQIVNGLRIIHPEIPPYLIVYDYEHRSHLKEKFIELIRNNNLNDIPEKNMVSILYVGILNGKIVRITHMMRLGCRIYTQIINQRILSFMTA